MNFVSVGDLSRFTMRNANAGLRSDIQRFSKEVTTGLAGDVTKHLNGDFAELAKMERGLSQATTYRRVASEAASIASAMQTALGSLQDIAEQTGANMISDATLSSTQSLNSVAKTAAGQLETAISALNTSAGGRFVFAGSRVTSPAVVSADDLISQAQIVVSSAATPDEALQLLQGWFDAAPGAGGFADNAYLGTISDAAKFSVEPDSSISFAQTANDAGTRKILLGLTVAALVSRGAFSGDEDARAGLMRAGGEALAHGNSLTTFARADLGMTEQRIERASVRMDNLKTTLQIERANLISVDPFEAGSHLTQAQAQLEALFSITARLSNLSLAKYL